MMIFCMLPPDSLPTGSGGDAARYVQPLEGRRDKSFTRLDAKESSQTDKPLPSIKASAQVFRNTHGGAQAAIEPVFGDKAQTRTAPFVHAGPCDVAAFRTIEYFIDRTFGSLSSSSK
jgi:hypothetical protein